MIIIVILYFAVVIHAIAPSIDDDDEDNDDERAEGKAITKCYQHSLELTLTHNIKSIVS